MVYIHFTDFFEVDPAALEAYGAFNVSLINDLPLFVDPFLLFNSEKVQYKTLHEGMIEYSGSSVIGRPVVRFYRGC